MKGEGCFHCYDCMSLYIHIQWSNPLFIISLIMGVQAQPLEIRIGRGGSTLLAILSMARLIRLGQEATIVAHKRVRNGINKNTN